MINDTSMKASMDSHRDRYYRSSRKRRNPMLLAGLSLGLILESAVMIVFFVKFSITRQDYDDLALRERRSTEQLNALQPQFERLKADLAAVTAARLPNLIPLEYNRAIAVDKDYVQSIITNTVGKREQLRYELKMVLYNRETNLVHPHVELRFFDRSGVQVGSILFGKTLEGVPTTTALEPDEVRSLSAEYQFDEGVTPEYLQVVVRK
jgi:hypothetical protein